MKIIYRNYGTTGLFGLRCAVFHRSFYLQDKVGNWYCDCCKKELFRKLEIL